MSTSRHAQPNCGRPISILVGHGSSLRRGGHVRVHDNPPAVMKWYANANQQVEMLSLQQESTATRCMAGRQGRVACSMECVTRCRSSSVRDEGGRQLGMQRQEQQRCTCSSNGGRQYRTSGQTQRTCGYIIPKASDGLQGASESDPGSRRSEQHRVQSCQWHARLSTTACLLALGRRLAIIIIIM